MTTEYHIDEDSIQQLNEPVVDIAPAVKSPNRIGNPLSVIGRGVRSHIRWHSPEEEAELLRKARQAY